VILGVRGVWVHRGGQHRPKENTEALGVRIEIICAGRWDRLTC
jgi:hypothetical protein